MTPRPSRRPPGLTAVLAAALLVAGGCTRHEADQAPLADFLLAAGDSTYWVENRGPGIKVRGSPLVIARVDSRFVELYVVDEDRSFENALFLGQRLYMRDLITGDSLEIFRDSLVPRMAELYERRNPEARRLEPDEDPVEEPALTASAEVSVLAVHGPFLSLEHHVDTAGSGDDSWHMTRHLVLDLRTGKQVSLTDVLGGEAASSVAARGRRLYRETVDSVRLDRRPQARRAARALDRFRFDPASFSLAAPNGTLMIAFSAPGQGSGGEGFVLPLRPLPVTEPAWWVDARRALPTATGEREERWERADYTVRAVYDTAGPVRLALLDSAGREFSAGSLSAPVHRIYWLDDPPIDRVQRNALVRAFNEAAMYDESARTAHGSLPLPRAALASRP
jgi:hypothetical protein